MSLVFVWTPDGAPLRPASPARIRTLQRDLALEVLPHHVVTIVELQRHPPPDESSPTLVGLVVATRSSTLYVATADAARATPVIQLTIDHRWLGSLHLQEASASLRIPRLPAANHALVVRRIALALQVIARLVPASAVLLLEELSSCSRRLLSLLRRELPAIGFELAPNHPETPLASFLAQTVRDMARGVFKRLPRVAGLCVRAVVRFPQRRLRPSLPRMPSLVAGLPAPPGPARILNWNAPPTSISLTAPLEQWNAAAAVVAPGSVCCWFRPHRPPLYGVVADIWSEMAVMLVPQWARNEPLRWRRQTVPIRQLRLVSNDALAMI